MKLIATHSGGFHADEVFAISVLMLIFSDVKVIRTRDVSELEKADMRVDVGLKYNGLTDFDHHQKEGAGKRKNGIPYASAGLVWKHFGKKLASEDAWNRIDYKIVQFIDAQDNGVKTFVSEKAKPYTISDIVEAMNPNWQGGNFDESFFSAVELMTAILQKEIGDAESLGKAEELVRSAISKSNGEYVVIDKYCPWKKVIVEETNAKFIVYPDASGGWVVRAVPVKTDSFEARKDLPKKWGGLEGEELAKITGVEDAVFCHRGLFIAGAKSKKGAIKLTELALK